jgi:ribosomal protein S12 methylthiotransferase
VPGVALRSTCIVGFPGETDDDVTRLLDLLEDVQFERMGVFTYSPQEGTRAHTLADDVPEALKGERHERVTEHQRMITAERYESRVGLVAQAMVDRPTAGADDTADVWCRDGVRARLSWQADDIDGITYLDQHDLTPGTIVEVRVNEVVDDCDFKATVRRIVSTPPSRQAAPSPRRRLPLAAAGATSAGTYGR